MTDEFEKRLSGLTIRNLPETERMRSDCLMVVSRKESDDHYETASVQYSTLSSRAGSDFTSMMRLGTMAYESCRKYAKLDHSHDSQYVRLDVLGTALSSPGSMKIMSIGIADGEGHETVYDVFAPQISVLAPTVPEIGTLKFIGSESRFRKITQDSIESDEWDGWAYPDGSEFDVDKNRFADALDAYGIGGNRIKLPLMQDFFETEPRSVSSFQNVLSQQVPVGEHFHDISGVAFSGTLALADNQTIPTYDGRGGNRNNNVHYGKDQSVTIGEAGFTLDLGQIKLNGLSCGDCVGCGEEGEFRPRNTRLPVMIYIGGVV